MIETAEEFIRLRSSEKKDEYDRASHESANLSTWIDIIDNHPEYKVWVVHNKTVPIEILEILAADKDPKVRGAVAGKRKISDKIFRILSTDSDESVRYSLIYNNGLTKEKIQQVDTADSEWLTIQKNDRLARHSA